MKKKIKKEDLSLRSQKVFSLSNEEKSLKRAKENEKSFDEYCPGFTVRECFKTDLDACNQTYASICMCPTESCKEEECASGQCTQSQGKICCAPEHTKSPATCAVLMTTKCQGTEVCLKTQNNCILSENGNCEFKPGLLTEEDNCVQTVDNCPAE